MFDALAARAIAAELNKKVVRGRVQAVLSLDDKTIGFEIYAQHSRLYLVASADSVSARIHLASEKLRASGQAPGPFVLLVRKYADGAFVNRVMARERERLIEIEFDHPEYGTSTLVAEMMGRLANLLLVDPGGLVLDAMKRITPAMSRTRTILPKSPYLPPPPQAKADPVHIGSQELERILADSHGERLWQVLVRSIAGTSPLLARELAFRVAAQADAESVPEVAKALQAELARVWSVPAEPTLAFDSGKPVAVAAFALTHLEAAERMDSMSAALEKYYGQLDSYEPAREPLRQQLEAARERIEKKCASLRREIVPEAQVERYKISGELVLAHSAAIRPGQQSLRAEMIEGQPLEIKLDARLTAIENAQQYFRQYRHAKDASAAVPTRLQEAEADLEFAEQMLEDLRSAETRLDIDAVIQEAREAGLLMGTRSGPRRGVQMNVSAQPRTLMSPEGFQVLVGRNARENEEVTFRRAAPQDWWFHARGVPGAHVVLVTNGRQAPESALEFAGSLAAYYSKAREERWVDVVLAPRKNVGRVSGRAARPGLVTVRGDRTLRVRPAEIGESGNGEEM